MQQDVQGEGGLAHAGAGGQQDQVGFVQTGDGRVHVGQAGGQAGDRLFAGGQLVEALVHVEDDAGDVLQALGGAALPDGVDALLGGLQHLAGGAGALLDHGGQVSRGLGDAPQQGLVLDDGGILLYVGRRRRDLHQLENIVAGGVFVIYPVQAHVLQHRHRVDGLGEIEHGIDGLIDLPVLPQIEVLAFQGFDDLRHAAGVNEHGAQHALLGLHAVGHLPRQKLLFGCHVFHPLPVAVCARANRLRRSARRRA